MTLSLSSCWNSHRHDDGYEMLVEIAGLGFEYVELSHGIRISLVAGILRALEDGVIQVSSVHNFCPLPMGVTTAAPNLYKPSSGKRRERAHWYRNTLQTLEFAERVGARAMVIHSGSVRFAFGSPADRLVAFRQAKMLGEVTGARVEKRYEKLRKRVIRKLEPRQKGVRKRVVNAYRSIQEAARGKSIRIGIENREDLEEYPLDAEMGNLLATLGEPEIFGYWHDAGHAEIKQQLGTLNHAAMLAEHADRQLGFHLHDVSPEGRDHRPLGTGVIDWEMVSGFIRPRHIVVLELSPRLTEAEVLASKQVAEDKILRPLQGG